MLVCLLALTAYGAVIWAAASGSARGLALSAVAVAAAEWGLSRWAPMAPWALARAALGLPWRWMTMVAALLVLATRVPDDGGGLPLWLLAGAIALAACAAALEGLADAVEYLRKSPVLSRNIPLDGLSATPEPELLLGYRAAAVWPPILLLVAGGALALDGTVSAAVGIAAVLLAAGLAAAMVAVALRAMAATRRAGLRSRVAEAVQSGVSALSPDVVLYYGGGPDALYQVEMWLATLETSRHRALVVLRDPESLRHLAPTSLPVVCIPAGTVLLSFDLRSARGALFVANGANNIHLLRKRGLRTAFIGHGDSDKDSSRNPFTKVYDEIWVAGPAGAERYAGHETAAVADRIRMVGRPQALLPPGTPRSAGKPVTVLYAPTWEGWGDEPYHSSLPHLGVELVRRLVDTPGVRLVYRPHPLTGTRDPRVRRAHRDVIAVLRGAGARSAPAGPSRSSSALARGDRGDDLSLMMARASSAAAVADSAADQEAADAFWDARGPEAHRIVEGAWPSLASCLLQSDALVSDVSGIVSDWIGLDRPFALCNPAGLGAAEFAHRFPSSGGGLLVGPGLVGLDELLADVTTGRDRCRPDRAVVRQHLLGSHPEDAPARFESALDGLVTRRERA